MKKGNTMLVAIALAVSLMFGGVAIALELPEFEGSFKYLPKAKVLTLGASMIIADFSKDDSEVKLSLSTFPMKLLYSSSVKASAAWTVNGDDERNGLIPDYGGLEASIDIMKLLRNMGANINTEVALTFDTGLLVGVDKLFENPATLDLQPAIGASVKIRFN